MIAGVLFKALFTEPLLHAGKFRVGDVRFLCGIQLGFQFANPFFEVFVLLLHGRLGLLTLGNIHDKAANALAVRNEVQHLLVPSVTDLDFAEVRVSFALVQAGESIRQIYKKG